MKFFLSCVLVFSFIKVNAQQENNHPNIFLITIDGYRWQELFKGADTNILKNPEFVFDTSLANVRWNGENDFERRKKLMPFFWNVIAQKGSLYGNRACNNKVDAANIYKFSYPGYNEILTGKPDIIPVLNTPTLNKNTNFFSLFDTTAAYKNKVAAFCSWSILKYIFNPTTSHFPVNAGYDDFFDDTATDSIHIAVNNLQNEVEEKERTRYDEFTFLHAKQYIKKNLPKLMMIGFGETDEYAHQARYDMYLQQANKIDNMIGELWYELQQIPFYKNNTIFIITTDHGRGKKQNKWMNHYTLIKGSREAWIAVLGNNIEAKGEVKTNSQLYLKQIAPTIAQLANINIYKPKEKINIETITSTIVTSNTSTTNKVLLSSK